jgi:hypothetical protein
MKIKILRLYIINDFHVKINIKILKLYIINGGYVKINGIYLFN